MQKGFVDRVAKRMLSLIIGTTTLISSSALPGLAAPAAAAPASGGSQRPPVRGIYVSANTAGSPDRMGQIMRLLDRTELNAVVVDVKNDWGNVTFAMEDPLVREVGAGQSYIEEIADFVETLRLHRVYRIARIVAFKDVPASKAHPEWAVADVDGALWQDSNGISWLDPYDRKAWEYIVSVARGAARAGFDEIQFDYVRFPTDGDLSRIRYPDEEGRSQQQVIADFLAYARQELHKEGVAVSADVFGLVTSAYDDMGIGQHLEEIAAATDYVSPMLYPSHYTSGNLGLENPNAMPYQTVLRSLQDAQRRIDRVGLTDQVVMRPWLQDFSWGYPYGSAEVRSEIQAVADAGYEEYLLWNAANLYTEGALRVTDVTMEDMFALADREAGPEVTVSVGQRPLVGFDPEVRPFVARTSGRTLVPLRRVAEALGATVDWDQASRTATVSLNGKRVQLPVGSRLAQVNGEPAQLDQPAVIWHERTVVPLRFLAESLGATVTWDAATGQVDLTLDGVPCAPGYCQE